MCSSVTILKILAVSALGNKRLASEELANDWDNKRLNPGNADYPLSVCLVGLLLFIDGLPNNCRS
jgi:hypothetical protein